MPRPTAFFELETVGKPSRWNTAFSLDRGRRIPQLKRNMPRLTPTGLPTTMLRVVAVVAFLAAACGKDGTTPSTSLVGTWDLIGFTDMGVSAVTTGTWVFRIDHTCSVNGTITFPGEPTDSLVADGTFVQSGNSVALTIAAQTGDWTLTTSGNEITLTENEPPPANTITLRRRP